MILSLADAKKLADWLLKTYYFRGSDKAVLIIEPGTLNTVEFYLDGHHLTLVQEPELD